MTYSFRLLAWSSPQELLRVPSIPGVDILRELRVGTPLDVRLVAVWFIYYSGTHVYLAPALVTSTPGGLFVL